MAFSGYTSIKAEVNFPEQCMYSNNKGKQQVQWLKSAVVNLPKIPSRFSFRDTKEFVMETKQSLSNVSLHVFKIVRCLKRACNILDPRSPIYLDSSGCREGLLPCCTCCRIDVNQLANNNDVVDQLSLHCL